MLGKGPSLQKALFSLQRTQVYRSDSSGLLERKRSGHPALEKFKVLLSRAGQLHSSPLTLSSPRLVQEPVPRGARGSMPAGVPGGPEPLPQLPEMPEPSFGESHSPHLPQPQVGRQGQGRMWCDLYGRAMPGHCAWEVSEPTAFLLSTAETSCHRCHLTSASCPSGCSLSATTNWEPCLQTSAPWEACDSL